MVSRYSTSYYIDVSHPGLNKFRRIQGKDRYVVERMAEQQMAAWDDQWARIQDRERRRELQEELRRNKFDTAESRRRAKEEERSYLASQEAEATQRTQEAITAIEEASTLLQATLKVDDAIDWDSLKRTNPFSVPKPQMPDTAWSRRNKSPRSNPPRPEQTDAQFQPELGFWDKLLAGRRRRKETIAAQEFQKALAEWQQRCNENAAADQRDITDHDAAVQTWSADVVAWEGAKAAFEAQKQRLNADIDERREAYLKKQPDAVLDYCQLVLHRSVYPSFVPKNFSLDYNPASGILIVDYQLPVPSDIPTTVEWRYVKKTDDFTEKTLTVAKAAELYDGVVHQITLRTIHELFEADTVNALTAIVFNGWIDHLDRAVGKNIVSYIVSLQVTKERFEEINLAAIDPKECFRALKGLSAARLSSLTPVAPIAQMNRDDARFIASQNVTLSSGQNLASMDWAEFEHLIRQLFEREFAAAGGEVRVTQASRDGGVDAVIFDPDPLRGGKIVVQAKRYTNVVGVSAVRDLYGTVQHEGATKGILVTTSSFGPDAYEFSKDKPLTLLDGQRLLYLLQRNGYEARIDLQEAKRMAANA